MKNIEYIENIQLEKIQEISGNIRKMDGEIEDYLLPRRGEILNIIRDHKILKFDQIRRRFMGVNERTLRYDLKKLQDAGLIRKRGVTKGVFYEYV